MLRGKARKKIRPKWRGIVKVQRQLAPKRDATALFTSRNGAIYSVLPMDAALLKMFGDDLKFYAKARLIHTFIDLGERVDDQNW